MPPQACIGSSDRSFDGEERFQADRRILTLAMQCEARAAQATDSCGCLERFNPLVMTFAQGAE
jgi:hypothetical protein